MPLEVVPWAAILVGAWIVAKGQQRAEPNMMWLGFGVIVVPWVVWIALLVLAASRD
jgi:hypothetical protein